MVLHGEAKQGKTWLADTAPAPRLVLDAEGGNRFTHSRKVMWDPRASAPPEADGTWDTCVVRVRDFNAMDMAFQWLNSGKHPFRSVTIDSFSEVAKRCMDSIAGVAQPQMQHWGELLRSMEAMVRNYRDLVDHPVKPLEVVTLICMTQERGDNPKARPMVQGQLGTTLPYFLDVIGYMTMVPTETGQLVPRLIVKPYGNIIAGDRTDRLPAYVNNPTIPMLLDLIYGPEQPATAAQAAEGGAS